MKAGELFSLVWSEYDINETTLMRALVDFSIDAELAVWIGETGHRPSSRDVEWATRLVQRGKAECVKHLHVATSGSLTPEADARAAR